MNPAVVVSLDFELRWGVLSMLGADMGRYRRNIEGVDEVVPRLLEMFASRGIRATWATVGALACRDWDEWRARAPRPPRYEHPTLRWRADYPELDPTGRLHFAPHLVDAIVRVEGQELASHSFGHLFFREPGVTRDDAVADTAAAVRVLQEKWDVTPRSFVFPRNQIAHTDVLSEHGIVCWRANPTVFYWNAATISEQSALVRLLRFADAVSPCGRRAAASATHRASYFIRLGLPQTLWRLHRRRIVRDAKHLRDDETLHLWVHPHNIGDRPLQGVARFAELADAIRDAAPRSTRFMSMGDVAGALASA
jgi:peptidoglycan/xylan/chitin deacetylase (PgdA/CDA1 family)